MSNHKIKEYHNIEVGDEGFLQTNVGSTAIRSANLWCVEKHLTLLTFENANGHKSKIDYINHELRGSSFMVEDPLPTVPGTFIQIEMAIPSAVVDLDRDLPESLPVIAILTDRGNWRTANRGQVTALLPEEITEWSHVKVEVQS